MARLHTSNKHLCELRNEHLRGESITAANIKLKRNLKKKGFIGYRK